MRMARSESESLLLASLSPVTESTTRGQWKYAGATSPSALQGVGGVAGLRVSHRGSGGRGGGA
jgi:hypothetical protein